MVGFSFVSLHSFEAPQPGWVQPLGQDSGAVFFQGAGLSQVEAATYMVGSSFISPTTQEEISSRKGITLFKNVCVDPELPEVIPASREQKGMVEAFLSPLLIAREYDSVRQNEGAGIVVTPRINSSQTQTLRAHSIDRTKVTLGQMPDIEIHQERINSFRRRFGNMPQIWHGTSRGAAVTFISAALAAKSNPALLQTVKLILLEGCYCSVESDVYSATNSPVMASCANTFFSCWYAYQRNGISPLRVLKDFPRTIPTVFITSNADKRVPKEETDKLVSELVNAGYDNIYYLILENSSHGNYTSDPQDALKYQAFVHALYKQLYLPYLTEHARAGQALVETAKLNAYAFKKS